MKIIASMEMEKIFILYLFYLKSHNIYFVLHCVRASVSVCVCMCMWCVSIASASAVAVVTGIGMNKKKRRNRGAIDAEA